LAQALHGQHDSASDNLQKVKELGGEDSAYWEYRALAAGLASEGTRSPEAAEKLQTLFDSEDAVLPWSLARTWAAAGEVEKAVIYLKKGHLKHTLAICRFWAKHRFLMVFGLIPRCNE